MSFQIKPLPASDFAHLYGLSDAELSARSIIRSKVTAFPGAPCRVSLEDAPVGSTILLLNYEHLPDASPYRARHAIYVRENAAEADIAPDTIPRSIASRLIAVRAYNAAGMMLDAEIAEGTAIAPVITRMLADAQTGFLHLHNASRGCYAAKVVRG